MQNFVHLCVEIHSRAVSFIAKALPLQMSTFVFSVVAQLDIEFPVHK